MDKDILTVIAKENSGFSKGQRLISRFILDNYDKAAFMTAGKLGKAVGVSESTVVRFASELGYEGYPEMRRAIQEMIRSRLTSVQRIEAAKDLKNSRDLLKSVMTDDIDKLQATLQGIDQEQFDLAVSAIVGAKKIYISAMRTSKILADFFGFYLSLMMDNVRVVEEDGASEIYEQLIRVDKGDVFIGFTFPRYSSRAVKPMKYAKEHGATAIGITDSASSPFCGEADICLFAKSEMVSFVDSLVAPMSLVNALIIAIGASRRDELSGTFRRLESVWSEFAVYEKIES